MPDEDLLQNQDLLTRAAKLLESRHVVFEDQMELIMGVLMILLDHPTAKRNFYLLLSTELTTKLEGKVLDKICTVINKTFIMQGEDASLNDDTALELIRDYLLEHDEFIFYKNEKRILRKPKRKKVKSEKIK
jgi:hypothetical protein